MDLKKILLFILIMGFCTLSAQRIAIMGAMDEEISMLLDSLKNKKVITKEGITFYTGKLKGQKVVLLKVGIGKVNAAYSTAILATNFKLKSIIFTGVAGGLAPEINPGDIVISDNLVQYDFGELKAGAFKTWPTKNLAQNNDRNPLYIPVDPYLLDLGKEVSEHIELRPFEGKTPKFFVGTIATGDTFLSDTTKAKELYSNFNALATEMEGAAVAQICTMLKVPFIVIRSCSDNANTQAHTDYFKFVKVAAFNSAHMVLEVLENYKRP
ncbi:5'-methylthioadenosine/adenosylhomocysteine nucleosidase [Maribacter sp. TH_r10]|uniref:5'-methylthioadenosine/adenosylhomocysteine nucleosidase n=1 Tax=Maribacter sp. TH_r10 TaxID=3082086 RepID=UPI002952E3AF|nr:5'-methylthioadenosine/adenosylhomocysteine nucleosidase [Maribacter sp. TH_r10]MDV7138222.1 5'-methylthioadenosine/adenosylhomocysteine nucleosidase [Maribacter sp. TH_r10]